ncbi:MAG TPA: DHA2 family efflux MFS transporter permease subunit [Ktedonobacterales bacterium]|nr:DHA2 family efflux MFS transporter permease subunit [Ktedonobacterales bacterium]
MRHNRYLIAIVAALGLIPIVLDTTIVTVALTSIRDDLHTDINTAQWIVTGFFLANAAVVAVGGYLASRFGRKRIFIVGLTIFTIGSLLCAISPGIGWLIAFRVVQGIGGGMLLPIGAALAFDQFPQEQRARASALIAIPILFAPVFGPILGGYLTDTFDWHSIFIVNLPVGIIAILLALLILPSDSAADKATGQFDYVGLGLSTLGIIAILYGLKLVATTNPDTVTAANPSGDLYGWGYWPVWTLIGGGAAALIIFAFYSLRISRDPALDLRQFARRDFLVSNLISWTAALITFGLLVLLPLYLEAIHLPNLSALDTGIAMAPLGVGTLIGTIVATALYRAVGPRWVVFGGAAISIATAWLLTQTIHTTADGRQILASIQTHAAIPATAGAADVRWPLLLLGIGFAMIAISVQTLALEALKGEALAKASSLVMSTKFIFSSVGVAILTTVLIDNTRSQATNLLAQLQAAAGQGAGALNPSNPALAPILRAIETQIGVQAGTSAIQTIFWLIFYGSFILLAMSLLLPGRNRPMAASETPAEESVPATVG